MNGKVYFMVEANAEIDLAALIERHLERYDVSVGQCLPECPAQYRMIVLWNLRRIIRDLPATSNFVVFHSSDLPKGRGWAPIYHSLADGHEEHVITAILAAPKVDAGDVIAKARFHIQPCHVADTLREIDEEVCVMLAVAILDRFGAGPIKATPQRGEATYYTRRLPSDSAVDIRLPLAELIPHIRACGRSHPAYFDWQGCRYRITLTPEQTPIFPDDLRINFEDAGDPT